MNILYRNTDQGQRTRSQLLNILDRRDGLTRQELVLAGLSYEQVRRQTQNLIIEGKVESRLVNRQRRYFIKSSNFVSSL